MFRTARFRLFVRKCCTQNQKRALLGDQELLSAVVEAASERYDKAAAGTLTDFLDWLLENQDAILALITKIIGLFSAPVGEPPANG